MSSARQAPAQQEPEIAAPETEQKITAQAKLEDGLKQLHRAKLVWTEYLLASINQLMTDAEYENVISDNFRVYQTLGPNVDPVTALNAFDKLRNQRAKHFSEIDNLTKDIDLTRKNFLNYKEELGNPTDLTPELTRFANTIHTLREAKKTLNKHYEENLKIIFSDLQYFINSLHYNETISNRKDLSKPTKKGDEDNNKIGFHCNAALEAFIRLKIIVEDQPTLALLQIYESINSIAGMRERILSPWEQQITKQDYRTFIEEQKSLEVSIAAISKFLTFPSKENALILKNNKLSNPERRLALLEEYLQSSIQNGQTSINQFLEILRAKKSSLESEKPTDEADKMQNAESIAKTTQLIQRLSDCQWLFSREKKYLENLQAEVHALQQLEASERHKSPAPK